MKCNECAKWHDQALTEKIVGERPLATLRWLWKAGREADLFQALGDDDVLTNLIGEFLDASDKCEHQWSETALIFDVSPTAELRRCLSCGVKSWNPDREKHEEA